MAKKFLNQEAANLPRKKVLDLEGQEQFLVEESLRPNFTKAELKTAILPKRIAKEIRWEKYWILFMNLIGTFLMLVAGFFLLAWFVASEEVVQINETTTITTKWLVEVKYLPQPWLMFIFLGVGLLLFIISWINYAHIISSVNRYKGDILMNVQSVPYFLIRSYRAVISRKIYINWISGVVYVATGISIGVMFAISAIKPEQFPLVTEKNISYIVLGLTFAFHLFSLILIKYRKGNLNAFYGKDLISLEEQRQISKTANRHCLIVFLIFIAILLIFVAIPWMLVRKRKGLKVIPFI